MILANGATLTARYEYSGFIDYYWGHSCADNDEHKEVLLYAQYGRKTILSDIIDDLVQDSWDGPASAELPEDVTDSDVCDVLLEEMLNNKGRSDYANGVVADCSAEYGADAKCTGCGASLTDVPDGDTCPVCYDWNDTDESPVFIVMLDYEYPAGDEEVCTECNEGKDCLHHPSCGKRTVTASYVVAEDC